ncbi:MAG: GHKL domain-containing protein [Gammaproteobacteria bacterium]|nr:GHKL domain-containing protein [Gammaproteobacteria bacterium]
MIRPEARRAEVRILTDLDPAVRPVLAQRIQIDQVIVNLLRNAIEAIAEAGVQMRDIRILTRMDDSARVVVTSVADTGPGLSEEIKNHLFTPFVTTKPKGMGLGLSISLGIIEAHNGNLFLETEPNAGAMFRFTLPVTGEYASK